jgi:hypothetical protein
MLSTRAISVLAAATVDAALTGCSAATSNDASPSDRGTASAPASPKAEKPADLAGNWKQSNSASPDAYQEATISGTTIEINWVSDGGDTKSLYWAGTYTAPTKAGDFTWTSTNDTAKTEPAMLASSDPTKEFTFSGDELSYSASALGTTTTIRMSREG